MSEDIRKILEDASSGHAPEPPKPIPRENPEPPKPRKPKEGIYKRLGMNRVCLSDINDIPPLTLGPDGFPIRPVEKGAYYKSQLSENQRKVRFLRMYNYSAGNILLCCQEAGITRTYYKKHWAGDPEFQEKIAEMREDIIDRALLRYHQRIGLVPGTAAFIHDAGLIKFLEINAPQILKPEPPKDDNPGQSNIPRATRPA